MNDPIPFPTRRKPRLKKLRLLLILVPLLALAGISTVFGMMMAVASDLPDLENRAEFKHSKNSIITDIKGRRLGILTSNQGRVLVPFEDINPSMVNAIIAIEDERFYTNAGVDLQAIGRAFVAYLGASRIAVSRDMRLSSPGLAAAFIDGATMQGADVVDYGMAATDMLYFGVVRDGLEGGAQITASHNPKEYNGVKMVRAEAFPLSGDAGIGEIREMVTSGTIPAPTRPRGKPIGSSFRFC